jgi:hypothetical protein
MELVLLAGCGFCMAAEIYSAAYRHLASKLRSTELHMSHRSHRSHKSADFLVHQPVSKGEAQMRACRMKSLIRPETTNSSAEGVSLRVLCVLPVTKNPTAASALIRQTRLSAFSLRCHGFACASKTCQCRPPPIRSANSPACIATPGAKRHSTSSPATCVALV